LALSGIEWPVSGLALECMQGLGPQTKTEA